MDAKEIRRIKELSYDDLGKKFVELLLKMKSLVKENQLEK
jgi:hypothetical protein